MKMDFSRVMDLMALRFGEAEAIVNVERARRFSFRAYHLLTNRIANMMRGALSLKRGDVAMAMLENDNLALLHLPTAFKQEAVIAFSNFRDSFEEHLAQLDFVDSKVVFIENKLLESYYGALKERGCTMIAMDPLNAHERPAGVLDFWELVDAADDSNPGVELDIHEHISIMRFTGGTTGARKCAEYTIDNFLAAREATIACRDFDLGTDTRMLLSTPISHGAVLNFWPTFMSGGATYTLNLPDLEQWAKTVERESITHGFLVPTLLYRLVDTDAAEKWNLKSLRMVLYGAAPMSPPRLAQLIERFGNIFVQAYGSTEVMQFITTLSRSDHVIDSDAARVRLGSAGFVMPGVELYVSDDEGNPVPNGTTGEIRVRSRATIRGYFKNPEVTAKEFSNGFWISGDVGYLDERGYLFLVDRKKDMIISGGLNIYATEVEAILTEHPAVSSAAVVGIPHPEWGEAVHAEVVLKPGCEATPDEIIDFAKGRLTYKAPKSVAIVAELPLSSVGKTLRRKVREKYWRDRERAIN